jgi:hypothetical protein
MKINVNLINCFRTQPGLFRKDNARRAIFFLLMIRTILSISNESEEGVDLN